MGQNQSNSSELAFLFDITSQMYIQLAIVTEQLNALIKIMYAKGLLDEEELSVINEDLETMVNGFADQYRDEEDDSKE
jgi:hypothetical protein